jgi:hypothetical protein
VRGSYSATAGLGLERRQTGAQIDHVEPGVLSVSEAKPSSAISSANLKWSIRNDADAGDVIDVERDGRRRDTHIASQRNVGIRQLIAARARQAGTGHVHPDQFRAPVVRPTGARGASDA